MNEIALNFSYKQCRTIYCFFWKYKNKKSIHKHWYARLVILSMISKLSIIICTVFRLRAERIMIFIIINVWFRRCQLMKNPRMHQISHTILQSTPYTFLIKIMIWDTHIKFHQITKTGRNQGCLRSIISLVSWDDF